MRTKHTIEVVIDRFKVRPDLAQRLSESFENALNLADGLAIVSSMDGHFKELLFSSRFACSECGYSLSELEPRLFHLTILSVRVPHVMGLEWISFLIRQE